MLIRRWMLLPVLFLLASGLLACDVIRPAPNPALPGLPTLPPVVVTATSAPTEIPAPTSAEIPTAVPPTSEPATAPTNAPTNAPAAATQTPFVVVVTATPPTGGTCSYKATFLGDVSIPDNTRVLAGTGFVKTWRLRNDGTCSWGTSGFALHSLVFAGGDQMGALGSISLNAGEVPPGGVIDVSVPMMAPAVPGTYRSNWLLQVDNGQRIGVGPRGTTALYTQIVAFSPSTTGGLMRIEFERGATNATAQGSLLAGQTQDYSISALEGQTMMLTLSSASRIVNMAVWGAQGINPQVLRVSPDGTFWLGILPVYEDYIVRVNPGGAAADYTLLVTIPQRITFAPGSIAAVTSGNTTERRTVTYLLKANAGQTMTATLTAPPGAAGLTIYGLTDGIPLVRALGGATTWSGTLPLTQDYVIEVVPATDAPFSFGLKTVVQ